MIATRYNVSALLKSQIDQLDHRLSELESSARLIGMKLVQLKRQAGMLPPEEPPKERKPSRRRRKLFTDEVLDQIPSWLGEGLGTTEIAERIGCSVNTLKVTCSNKGISLRIKKYVQQEMEEEAA